MRKFLSICLVGLLYSTTCASGAGLDSDTKLYLPFDENTLGATTVDGALEVLDYGSGGKILTSNGTSMLYQTANTKVWNAALDFDGSVDSISCTDHDGVDGASNLSGSAWVKCDDLTKDGIVFNKGSLNNSNVITLMRDEVGGSSGRTNTMKVFIGNDSNSTNVEGANEALNDSNWHQVGFTFTGGSSTGLRLYIDGVEDANSPATTVGYSTLLSKANLLYLGNDSGNSKPWTGQQGDHRLWSRVLSDAEMLALYNEGNGTTASQGDNEILWVQDVQEQSGDGGSGDYHIPAFVGTAQLDTATTCDDTGSDYTSDTSSLFLDGNSDYVQVPDSADWDFIGSNSQDYTVDGWIRLDTHTATSYIIGQAVAADAINYWYLFHTHGVGPRFYALDGAAVVIGMDSESGEITDSDWHHLAVIKATSGGPTVDWAIYLDGVRVDSTSDTDTETYAGDLYLGVRQQVARSDYVDGNMAHWRINASNIFGADPSTADPITVPKAPYTLAVASGWTHIINGVTAANMAKVNTVAKANIAEINQT